MINVNDIDLTIIKLLEEIKVSFSVVLLGETIKNDWVCDHWRATFTNGSKSETFDYFTGLGHRLSKVDKNKRLLLQFSQKDKGAILKRKKSTGESRVIYGDNWCIAPTSASVLYSLVLDSGAADESFSNWCDNFGYDSDSISAFNVYQECEKTAKRLKNIFNHSQLEQLRELLQDY